MTQRRPVRWPQWIMALGVMSALAVVALGIIWAPTSATPAAQQPSASSRATAVPHVVTTPAHRQASVPEEGIPETLTIESIGFMATPLDRMVAGPRGSTLVPPAYADDPARNFMPYWLEDRGLPGVATNDNVFIVGHACAGECVDPLWLRFNRLSELKVGELITFGTTAGDISYRVTDNLSYTEASPSDEAKRRVWKRDVPHQLQVISCSESVPGSGIYDQRTVVFATLVR